jgi:hypothetical protein
MELQVPLYRSSDELTVSVFVMEHWVPEVIPRAGVALHPVAGTVTLVQSGLEAGIPLRIIFRGIISH